MRDNYNFKEMKMVINPANQYRKVGDMFFRKSYNFNNFKEMKMVKVKKMVKKSKAKKFHPNENNLLIVQPVSFKNKNRGGVLVAEKQIGNDNEIVFIAASKWKTSDKFNAKDGLAMAMKRLKERRNHYVVACSLLPHLERFKARCATYFKVGQDRITLLGMPGNWQKLAGLLAEVPVENHG